MAKFLTEILQEINEDPKKLDLYKADQALRILLEYAFMPEHKFILPDGDAPFKPDAAPLGMTPANLRMEIKRLYVFCRKDLKPIKREQLYIGLLEGIHPTEAALLVAVKDQKLNKLYPKITRKLLEGAGWIPKLDK
jgi:hypothetical protein